MITVHISGINLDSTLSHIESYSFKFDGQNDSETELSIINQFNQMISDGLINVYCVNEDSQVDLEDNHLRFSDQYAFKNNHIVSYIPDYTNDELMSEWGES